MHGNMLAIFACDLILCLCVCSCDIDRITALLVQMRMGSCAHAEAKKNTQTCAFGRRRRRQRQKRNSICSLMINSSTRTDYESRLSFARCWWPLLRVVSVGRSRSHAAGFSGLIATVRRRLRSPLPPPPPPPPSSSSLSRPTIFARLRTIIQFTQCPTRFAHAHTHHTYSISMRAHVPTRRRAFPPTPFHPTTGCRLNTHTHTQPMCAPFD